MVSYFEYEIMFKAEGVSQTLESNATTILVGFLYLLHLFAQLLHLAYVCILRSGVRLKFSANNTTQFNPFLSTLALSLWLRKY